MDGNQKVAFTREHAYIARFGSLLHVENEPKQSHRQNTEMQKYSGRVMPYTTNSTPKPLGIKNDQSLYIYGRHSGTYKPSNTSSW
jgi:hypothetical protein